MRKMVLFQLDGFVSHVEDVGWFPKKAARLTTRLMRNAEIHVVDKGDHTLIILSPDTDRNVSPTILIDTPFVRSQANFISSFASEVGVTLSQEQALNAGICSSIAHEWAHSIEDAFERKPLSFKKKLQLKWQNYLSNYHFNRRLELNAQKLIMNEAVKVSKPLTDEQFIWDWEGQIALKIHKERFVASFEIEAINYSLIRSGISQLDTRIVVDGIKKMKLSALEDIKSFRKFMGQDADFWIVIGDIKKLLHTSNMDDDLLMSDDVVSPYGFGYFSQYEPEQVKAMLNASLLKLNQKNLEEIFICSILEVKKIFHEQVRRQAEESKT